MTESNKKPNKQKIKSQVIFDLGHLTISPNKIEKDERIYPRERISQKTIESYYEALQSGAKFPPVLLQKIYDENNSEKIISIDGYHRTEAYKLAKIEIPYEWYKDEILDINEYLKELHIVSIKRNLTHGDRLSNKDKKFICRKMAKEDVDIEIAEQEFANLFGVASRKTINNWIGDIRTTQKGTRDNYIIRLYTIGYTQTEIADKLNITQQTVSEITKNGNFTEICSSWKKGKTPSKVAEYYGLDIPVVWSILLKDVDDLERFELFGNKDFSNEQPKMSDYWRFSKRDTRLGIKYPGMLWGNEVMNILYRYSKQGDLIIDPMAGGGTVIDTCLIMGRKCKAFDIKPYRDDIEQGDITKEFPADMKKGDLIVFDPPYHKKKEEEYECQEITENKITFLKFLNKASKNCYKILKDEKYLALIFSQYIDYENEGESILGLDYGKIFENNGFKLILEIQTPLIFDVQYNPHSVENAKKYDPWRILPISRSWYIFKKEENYE